MLYNRVFEDKIIVYWDRQDDFRCGYVYRAVCDGKEIIVDKTHCSFSSLIGGREYTVTVELADEKGQVIRVVGEITVKTPLPRKRLNVKGSPYSATGDGKTFDTEAIQRAINDCGKNETVYLPAGEYLCGALYLHGDMELYLAKDAILRGTDEVDKYLPKIKSRFEGIEMQCYASLINLGEVRHCGDYACENVIIRGEGKIVGGGKTLCENTIKTERESLIKSDAEYAKKVAESGYVDTVPGRARGRLIAINHARNVTLEGLSVGCGASWTVHVLYSDDVVVTGIRFFSDGVWNGDGCDPDSSTNCTIFNCIFNTYDDCVAIKSGKNPEGNVINKPCENIKVFDCRSTMGHGCSVGSEMSGGVENVYIWDCDFEKSMFGITVKATKKRGGYVKNVFVNDCKTSRIMIRKVPYNDDGIPAPTVPVFENFVFDNVSVTGVEYARETEQCFVPAIALSGFDKDHRLKNVTLKNIVIKPRADGNPQTIELCDLSGVSIENIKFD